MKKNGFDYADLFWASEESHLPKPEGLAAKWYKLKAQAGNCHPGSVLPFGMVSALAYSGGYPTGYGVYRPNSFARPGKYFSERLCKGFTHFQVSGTGAILKYYNFFRVIPLAGGIDEADTLHPLAEEAAHPGYYTCRLGKTGIRAELAAAEKSIFHRYTFQESSPTVAIDLLQCGIAMKDHDKNRILEAKISRRSPGCYDAYIFCDLPIYACIRFDDPQAECSILLNKQSVSGTEVTLPDPYGHQLHLLCSGKEGKTLGLQIAFSMRSNDQAYSNLKDLSFDEAEQRAAEIWKDTLSCIEIETPDEKQKEIFYSALYQSLIKPSNFENESPFWNLRPDCYLEFATLWDQYKTALPLIFTLFDKNAAGIVNGLLNVGEYQGEFPNTIVMSQVSISGLESQQALSLAVYGIVDAYWRGVKGVDWERALRIIDLDLTAKNKSVGHTTRITHYLDYAEACLSAAKMADDLGHPELAEKFREFSSWGDRAYDKNTGILCESDFYEGHIKTYSYRLMHDMEKRIALYPDRQKLIDDLDAFFGFTSEPAPQEFEGMTGQQNDWNTNHYQRFEGTNNEPDMEVPYFYLYLNQHYKTAEIIRDAFRYMFTTGRGGLSGNNDSGGLSSWYVWNTIGLFPVTGQNLILIGTPMVQAATIRLSNGNSLRIEAENFAPDHIYVEKVLFNGKELSRKWLTVRELMEGGTLQLVMTAVPTTDEQMEFPHN
ncbi:MAG: glycoside hydrolase domain-containing protein [Candidatus Merdivicinus sp.]|jgi:putative alpha-1,2-mannosidase